MLRPVQGLRKGGAMGLMTKKTDEEKAAKAARKEQERLDTQAQKAAEEREKARQAFLATPAGQARLAFERGDHLFQCGIDVMSQEAIIVAMVGSSTSKKTTDPVAILNSVCHEGWDVVNGSFVFVEEGQQSRDKFLASGQNVAIKGTTVGYYLFRRSEDNRRETGNPWETDSGSNSGLNDK